MSLFRPAQFARRQDKSPFNSFHFCSVVSVHTEYGKISCSLSFVQRKRVKRGPNKVRLRGSVIVIDAVSRQTFRIVVIIIIGGAQPDGYRTRIKLLPNTILAQRETNSKRVKRGPNKVRLRSGVPIIDAVSRQIIRFVVIIIIGGAQPDGHRTRQNFCPEVMIAPY